MVNLETAMLNTLKREVKNMRWFHISDIHFGYDSATVNTMRKKLLAKAKQIKQVDCLFITGDLRYGKNERSSYPPETLRFVRDLQSALNVKPEDTFIVPGNHDVNRGDGALKAIIEAEANSYSTINGKIGTDTLSFIKTKRAPFLDLYREICNRNEPDWHYCHVKNGFNIICLNTAILCGRDNEDGNLIVGSELINKLAESIDSNLPGIVLAHHDFDALRQEEQQNLEIALKEMGAVLYLCGHKHVALSHLQNTFRANQNLRVFLCGTSMDKDPIMSQTDMDFFVGEIDNAGSNGYVQAFKWYPRSSHWAQDVEFSLPQDYATDGIYYFPQDTRPKTETLLRKDVLERYRQYIQGQCGEIEQNGLPMNEEDILRRYALRRIFVPLAFQSQISQEDDDAISAPKAPSTRIFKTDSEPIPLSSLIPNSDCFRMVILSDPGGGKTTLLKWISLVYCFPDEYDSNDSHLPKRELFPIWLRCRDISEGSRPTVWNTIQNIALRGEWLPNGSDAGDFIALVSHHITRGTLLLLIDGLDEIGNDADREYFVEQLRAFADNYPTVNILVSSRPTGFSIVSQGMFQEFDRYTIAPLKKEDISSLCVKWNIVVKGDSEEAKRDALKLAKRITDNERIFRLASNPLLLTTLLLVERRVGRLPTKRADLYEEAIQVLLETWNRRGHEHQPIDLDEARYQLAYIAFHMMANHEKQITRTKLTSLLKEARKELSELVSAEEKPTEFIKNIEQRSALLIQKGYKRAENGRRDAVYEFQHLTFQEYLAACAINESCYPGAQEGDDPVNIITPYLTDKTMKEVISLVAVRLGRFYPNKLVDGIITKLRVGDHAADEQTQLRDLLLQFVADEVPLSAEKIDQILSCCFERSLWSTDVGMLRQILEGRNSHKLKSFFIQVDKEHNNGYNNWVTLLDILAGTIPNPYEYYRKNYDKGNGPDKIRALFALAGGFWLSRSDIIKQLTKNELANLKQELFNSAKDSDLYIRRAALFALRDADFVRKPDEFSEYISCLANNINEAKTIPSVVSIYRLDKEGRRIIISSDVTLSDEALDAIIEEIESKELMSMYDYGELLTITLLALVCCSESQDISKVLYALRQRHDKFIERNSSLNEQVHRHDIKLFSALQYSILPCITTQANELALQEHILKTDLAWIQQKRKNGSSTIFYEGYTDYSQRNEQLFTIPLKLDEKSSNSLVYQDISDEITNHVYSRLKTIGCLDELSV